MRELTFYEEEHIYLTDEGVEVPSVTTILGYISLAGYKQISQSILDYAANRGKLVHECLELYDYGVPFENMPIVTPEIQGYIKAYLDFLRDYRPEWSMIEQVVDCEEDNYCGTLDRAGVIGGKFAVVDLKTNASPTVENKICVCGQTYAYAKALEYPDCERLTLYLKADGNYTLMDCKKYEQEKQFTGADVFEKCLDLYRTVEGIKAIKRRRKPK